MAGKLFLEKLLLKLKTGNSRSIHLNALPGRYARLDLHELINIWQGLHLRFINDLLNKPKFRFTISIDPKHLQSKSGEEVRAVKKIISRLNSLYYQQQDEFLEHGTQTFAFGYPLLIKRDNKQPNKILKAPLVIWYLDIQKDLHTSNTWTISRNEDSPVLFNEVLRSNIETNDRIRMDDLLEQFDDDAINEKKLSQICALMLEKLGTTSTEQDLEVKVLPGTNKESIEKITENDPWIRWSGIFGLYRTQKQSIIKDVEQFLSEPEILQPLTVSDGPSNTTAPILPAVATDPSQEFILTSLRDEDNVIIQGPPGTGKSQSLSAIITDALYHQKNCLVVCEKKTALDVIHANLTKAGLSEFCIIIDDVHRDRKKVVERVRHLLEVRNDSVQDDFRHHEFQETIDRFEHLRSDAAKHLKLVNATCFGDDSVSDLVARVQKLKQENRIASIDEDVRGLFKKASYGRYKEFETIVAKGKQLYEPVGKVLSFDSLDDSFFDGQKEYDSFFQEVTSSIDTAEKLLSIYADANCQNALLFNDHSRWNRFKVSVGSLFSANIKKIARAREFILTTYPGLCSAWKDRSYIDVHLPPIEEGGSLDVTEQPLKNMVEQLTPILQEQDAFSSYLPWRQYRISLNGDTAQLLLIMSRNVLPPQWEDTFTHAYLNEFIVQYCNDNQLYGGLPGLLDSLHQNEESVLDTVSGKVVHKWNERQSVTLRKRTIASVKQLYNFRRNKSYGTRNSLRKIVHEDFELFSTAFPVVLVSPTVCSSIFPLRRDLFDHVIFDEASQLRIEDTFAALYRGQKKIISGDKHQMPPSSHFMTNVILMNDAEASEDESSGVSDDFLAESNSLLEYGMDTDFKSVFLDFHYRSHHPDLIAFSNASFYGNRLVPMPAKPGPPTPALEFQQVDGIYQKDRINPLEAEAIVRYIYQKIELGEHITPSIGIATFNINQRNFIWDLLMKQTFEDPKKAVVLDRLMEHGLFVKNLENIQGDERDVILISTTFGPDENNGFRQQFGPVTRSDGYCLLNVIITRARNKMVVFTSIPEQIRNNYTVALDEKGNNGNAIFYSFLAYAQAVSSDDSDRKQHILELVDAHCAEKPFLHESKRMPLYHQLIYSALLEKFDSGQVAHNFRFGGFILDLAILKSGKPIVAISTNHMKQQTSTSYKLFNFKSNILEQHGVATCVADVLDWNSDWDGEMSKLVTLIEAKLEK